VHEFDLEFTESRSLGATWALDVLWNRLGIGETMRRVLADRDTGDSAERVLFALVANRALAPSAKLAARWVSEDVIISGLPATSDDACYQAMDLLPEIKDALENEVFERVTSMPDQAVDLLVFGTATCSETDQPQIVGVAVTRHGLPVRAWSWSGNTAESALIRQVRDDMGASAPTRIVWVANRGFSAAGSRRDLRADGRNQYIIGAKLRSGSAEAEATAAAALSRPDRYQDVAAANLRVMEIPIGSGERLVLCHDPGAAERDAAVRARMLAHLEELIRDADTLSSDMRAEKLRGFTVARHGRHRYLRVTASGQLRIDLSAVRAEEKFDGKYLLRASDTAMTAEDIALRYRQLLEVERGWRSMQQMTDPRPGYRHTEGAIRAHAVLCWLALLLARVTENACHDTWPKLRHELDRIAIGTFTGPTGTFRLRTEITSAQLDILAKLAIDPPPRISQFTPASS
jgi:transposase